MMEKFSKLSTGWKILTVLLVFLFIGSGIYVLSGQYDEDQAREQAHIDKQAQDEKSKKEKLDLAYKKCMLMEMKDIYDTPDDAFIGKEYTKQQALSPANTFCVDQRNASEDDFIESAEEDWKTRQNEAILGNTLAYWLENYHEFPQKYYDSFE